MSTPIQLATGLGGAIGSDFVLSRNQVYFVEFNGKVSVLDLVRPLGHHRLQRNGDYACGLQLESDQRHIGARRAYQVGSHQPWRQARDASAGQL